MALNFNSEFEKAEFQKILKEFGRSFLFLVVSIAGLAITAGLHLSTKTVIACDAETVKTFQEKPYFYLGEQYFKNGNLQSDEVAHSGKFSARLTDKQRFAFGISTPTLTGYERVTATVWRYQPNGGDGMIVFSIKDKILWKSGNEVIQKESSGWEKIRLSIKVPLAAKYKKLDINFTSYGRDIIFFDDVYIEVKQEEKL